MTDSSDNNIKTINLTHTAERRWLVEFTGRVTRRDLIHIRRVLTVEYAKHERKRRTAKIHAKHSAKVTPEEPVTVKIETTEPVTTERVRNVYKP
jgi:hypothetical protein